MMSYTEAMAGGGHAMVSYTEAMAGGGIAEVSYTVAMYVFLKFSLTLMAKVLPLLIHIFKVSA